MAEYSYSESYRAKGIMSGLERATATLLDLSLKKRQLKQDDEKFNLEMKINNLKLKHLENEADPEYLELQKSNLKDTQRLQKAFNTMMLGRIRQAELKVKNDKTALESELGNEVNYARGRAAGQMDMAGTMDLGFMGEGWTADPNALIAGKGVRVLRNGRTSVSQKKILADELFSQGQPVQSVSPQSGVDEAEDWLSSLK